MKTLTLSLLSFVVLFLFGCHESSNPNILDSADYGSKEERVEILEEQIVSNSDFENADFVLFNVNGFAEDRLSVPGASSWDYKFVIKVLPINLDKWTEGMIASDDGNYDISWVEEIRDKRKDDWKTESQPELYTKEGVILVMYRSEGVVFKRIKAD